MSLRAEVPRQDVLLTCRMYRRELETIKKAAKNAGKSVSDWVRESLLLRAKRAA